MNYWIASRQVEAGAPQNASDIRRVIVSWKLFAGAR
jgi:hypothetical protein